MDAYNFTDLCTEPTFGQIGVSKFHFPLKEKLRLLGEMANSGSEAGKEHQESILNNFTLIEILYLVHTEA